MGERPLLLDLFCGAGGAAMGYHRAGFDVVGVDIAPQPHYPFELRLTDSLNMPAGYIGGHFNAVHASPPCQRYSHGTVALDKEYPDLIAPIRKLLRATGLPYAIENVPRAPLESPVVACGASLGRFSYDDQGPLTLRRHRLFESNVLLRMPPCCCKVATKRGFKIAGCYGGASRTRERAEKVRHGGYVPTIEIQQDLMGIDWMTEHELHQAIPPTYTYWIGRQLMDAIRYRESA